MNSPIVDGDLVIIGMMNASWGDQARGRQPIPGDGQAHRRAGMVGRPRRPPQDTYYSVPVVAGH